MRSASSSGTDARATIVRGRAGRTACVALVLALGCGACATATAPSSDESIVVPEGARQVDRISSLRASPDRWEILNTHMVLVSNIGRDYLIVFEDACRGLARVGATISYRRSTDLEAGTIVHVEEYACPIDRIYEISEPDSVMLRERFAD